MANLTITNNASATLQVWQPVWQLDQTFTGAAATTYKSGMLLTLTAGKYVPFVSGSGEANAVLPFEFTTVAAGDYPITALIGGEVRQQQLGIGVAMTVPPAADILSLQDYGIIARPTNQLGELDNQ
jgi:hypothetical protein